MSGALRVNEREDAEAEHEAARQVDPAAGDLLVRSRIDGSMRDITRVGVRQTARVISRIKISASSAWPMTN